MTQTATSSAVIGLPAARSLPAETATKCAERARDSFYRHLRLVPSNVPGGDPLERDAKAATAVRSLTSSPGVDELRLVLGRLGELALGGTGGQADDVDRIDTIAALESIIAAASGARSRVEVEFYDSQVAGAQARGVPARRRGRGVADQIGLARRIGPVAAARELRIAHGLVTELPCTFRALAEGRVGYRSAAMVAARTDELSRPDRAAIDADLAPRLPGWSIRQVQAAADRAAYAADPQGAVDRAAKAAKDRHVSLRPAPDCMTRLSALLPVREGVSVIKHLEQAAAAARTAGDSRGRGQVMADTLVERVTGQARAADVDLEVGVVITDEAYAGASDQPETSSATARCRPA